MTRQVALGAVVAFVVTVIALSMCEPKAPLQGTPSPVAAPTTPAPTPTATAVITRPAMLRGPELMQPELMMRPTGKRALVDAGQ